MRVFRICPLVTPKDTRSATSEKLSHSERATEVCERLRKSVAASACAEQGLHSGAITVSIGLASAGSYHLQGLLHAADKALYRAKREGRNRLALGGR